VADNPPVPPPSGGGALSKKVLGLPTWGWIAVAAAAGVVGYVWLQSRKKNAASDSSGQTLDNSNGSSDPNGIGAYASDTDQALLAQIRDLQGAQSTAVGDDGDTSTTPEATTPGQVTGLKAVKVTTSLIWLTWNGVVGARGYDITWTDAQSHVGNATSLLPGYTMFNLPRGEKYTIKVRAKHDLSPLGTGTDGEWSAPITATTSKV
jgi:hypothetical protein